MHHRRFSGSTWKLLCGPVLCLLGLAAPVSAVNAAERNSAGETSPSAGAASNSIELAVFEKSAPADAADLLAIQKHVQQLAERVRSATVAVRIGKTHGSGVIVSEDGYVLTAAHVAGDSSRPATLILPDGKQVRGKTLGLMRLADAALIKITEEGPWPHVEMGEIADVEAGDWCLAFGHPRGYRRGRQPVMRLGRVLYSGESLIQTDCTLVGGDSGGPLFDIRGNVIGVHSRISPSISSNYHVPVTHFENNWDKLRVARKPAESGFLGVGGRKHDRGCKVTSVVPNTPAETAGIESGDIVASVDGTTVTGFDQMASLIREKKPGDEVTLQIIRGEVVVEKSVMLTSRR